jgi:glutamate racemase
MNTNKIGVFDSGVGGLTVLKKAIELLPNENFIYLGDEARMPYGSRPKDEIIRFSLQISNFFVQQHNIKMLVVACNTATAQALPELQKQLSIPVIGVIDSGAKYVFQKKLDNVGVIATQGTVESMAYKETLNYYGVNVVQKAEPEFVTIVENSLINTRETYEFVKIELQQWAIENQIKNLILGCTHYPLLIPVIQKVLGKEVSLIDAGECEANDIKEVLQQNNLLNNNINQLGQVELLTTGDFDRFKNFAGQWLNGQYSINKVEVENI